MKLVVLVLLAILALSGYAPVVHGKHAKLYSAFRSILKKKDRKRVKELIESGRLRFAPDTTSEQKAQFVAMMSGSKGGKGSKGRQVIGGVEGRISDFYIVLMNTPLARPEDFRPPGGLKS